MHTEAQIQPTATFSCSRQQILFPTVTQLLEFRSMALITLYVTALSNDQHELVYSQLDECGSWLLSAHAAHGFCQFMLLVSMTGSHRAFLYHFCYEGVSVVNIRQLIVCIIQDRPLLTDHQLTTNDIRAMSKIESTLYIML